jgi:UDP-3-O-[3-hydroxymyristoyl] glucosamine N-acyltransferase
VYRPRRVLLGLRTRGRLVAAADVRLGRGVVWDIAPGGLVVLADRVAVGAGCRFHVGPAARVVVGAGARLAEGCALLARERIEVGASAVLAAQVVLADFRHDAGDVETPVRLQRLITAPVLVAERAILDPAAVVEPGVTVGPAARVGPRSVVTADVPAGALVVGVPARAPGTPPPRGMRLLRRR